MPPRKQSLRPNIPPTKSPQEAIPLIQRQMDRLSEIQNLEFNDPKVAAWESTTVNSLNAVLGQPNGEPDRRTLDIEYADGDHAHVNMNDHELQVSHITRCKNRRALLEALIEQLQDLAPSTNAHITSIAGCVEDEKIRQSMNNTPQVPTSSHLKTILNRFHSFAKQLRERHTARSTLIIEDEYDVQDLLHALLRIDFDDIRPEESTPSYAGGSSRMDFLLKKEKIVVEVKKTRKGLGSRELGDELSIDIARYRSHPDCKTLICFIYDPDNLVNNPIGFKNDLEKMSSSELNIEVVINPIH